VRGKSSFLGKRKIASANKGDKAPVSHPLGFTLSQDDSFAQLDTSSLWADYWKIEDLDSKTSKEFFDKAAKPTIGSENEKDIDPSLPA
jgi:hypothetical protein